METFKRYIMYNTASNNTVSIMDDTASLARRQIIYFSRLVVVVVNIVVAPGLLLINGAG